jgi:hypothetical protein
VRHVTVGPDFTTPHYKRASGGVYKYTPETNVRKRTELLLTHRSTIIFRSFVIIVTLVALGVLTDMHYKITNKVEEEERIMTTPPTSVFNFAADFNGATIDFESTTTKMHYFGLFIDKKNTPEKLLSEDNAKGQCWCFEGQ